MKLFEGLELSSDVAKSDLIGKIFPNLQLDSKNFKSALSQLNAFLELDYANLLAIQDAYNALSLSPSDPYSKNNLRKTILEYALDPSKAALRGAGVDSSQPQESESQATSEILTLSNTGGGANSKDYLKFFDVQEVPGDGSCFYHACVVLAEKYTGVAEITPREDGDAKRRQTWIDSTAEQQQRQKNPSMSLAEATRQAGLLWAQKLKSDGLRDMLVSSLQTSLQQESCSASLSSAGLDIKDEKGQAVTYEALLNAYVASGSDPRLLQTYNILNLLPDTALQAVLENSKIINLLRDPMGERTNRTVAQVLANLRDGEEANFDAIAILQQEIFERPFVIINTNGQCENIGACPEGVKNRTPVFFRFTPPQSHQNSGHYDALLPKQAYSTEAGTEVRITKNSYREGLEVSFKTRPMRSDRSRVTPTSSASSSSHSSSSHTESGTNPEELKGTTTTSGADLGGSGVFVDSPPVETEFGSEASSRASSSDSQGHSDPIVDFGASDSSSSMSLSQAEALLKAPVHMDYSRNNGAMKLSSSNVETVAQYPGLGLSKGVTAIHPYDPLDGGNVSALSVVLQFKGAEVARGLALPAAVQAKLTELGVNDPSKITVSFTTQDKPWAVGTAPLLRPHSAVIPDAPESQSGYNVQKNVSASLFNVDALQQANQLQTDWAARQEISAHTADDNLIVSSPNNLPLPTSVYQDDDSALFISVVVADGEAHVTYHALLSESDQDALNTILVDEYFTPRTVAECLERFEGSQSPALQQFAKSVQTVIAPTVDPEKVKELARTYLNYRRILEYRISESEKDCRNQVLSEYNRILSLDEYQVILSKTREYVLEQNSEIQDNNEDAARNAWILAELDKRLIACKTAEAQFGSEDWSPAQEPVNASDRTGSLEHRQYAIQRDLAARIRGALASVKDAKPGSVSWFYKQALLKRQADHELPYLGAWIAGMVDAEQTFEAKIGVWNQLADGTMDDEALKNVFRRVGKDALLERAEDRTPMECAFAETMCKSMIQTLGLAYTQPADQKQAVLDVVAELEKKMSSWDGHGLMYWPMRRADEAALEYRFGFMLGKVQADVEHPEQGAKNISQRMNYEQAELKLDTINTELRALNSAVEAASDVDAANAEEYFNRLSALISDFSDESKYSPALSQVLKETVVRLEETALKLLIRKKFPALIANSNSYEEKVAFHQALTAMTADPVMQRLARSFEPMEQALFQSMGMKPVLDELSAELGETEQQQRTDLHSAINRALQNDTDLSNVLALRPIEENAARAFSALSHQEVQEAIQEARIQLLNQWASKLKKQTDFSQWLDEVASSVGREEVRTLFLSLEQTTDGKGVVNAFIASLGQQFLEVQQLQYSNNGENEDSTLSEQPNVPLAYQQFAQLDIAEIYLKRVIKEGNSIEFSETENPALVAIREAKGKLILVIRYGKGSTLDPIDKKALYESVDAIYKAVTSSEAKDIVEGYKAQLLRENPGLEESLSSLASLEKLLDKLETLRSQQTSPDATDLTAAIDTITELEKQVDQLVDVLIQEALDKGTYDEAFESLAQIKQNRSVQAIAGAVAKVADAEKNLVQKFRDHAIGLEKENASGNPDYAARLDWLAWLRATVEGTVPRALPAPAVPDSLDLQADQNTVLTDWMVAVSAMSETSEEESLAKLGALVAIRAGVEAIQVETYKPSAWDSVTDGMGTTVKQTAAEAERAVVEGLIHTALDTNSTLNYTHAQKFEALLRVSKIEALSQIQDAENVKTNIATRLNTLVRTMIDEAVSLGVVQTAADGSMIPAADNADVLDKLAVIRNISGINESTEWSAEGGHQARIIAAENDALLKAIAETDSVQGLETLEREHAAVFERQTPAVKNTFDERHARLSFAAAIASLDATTSTTDQFVALAEKLLVASEEQSLSPRQEAFNGLLNEELDTKAVALIDTITTGSTALLVEDGTRFKALSALKALDGIKGTARLEAVLAAESAALDGWIAGANLLVNATTGTADHEARLGALAVIRPYLRGHTDLVRETRINGLENVAINARMTEIGTVDATAVAALEKLLTDHATVVERPANAAALNTALGTADYNVAVAGALRGVASDDANEAQFTALVQAQKGKVQSADSNDLRYQTFNRLANQELDRRAAALITAAGLLSTADGAFFMALARLRNLEGIKDTARANGIALDTTGLRATLGAWITTASDATTTPVHATRLANLAAIRAALQSVPELEALLGTHLETITQGEDAAIQRCIADINPADATALGALQGLQRTYGDIVERNLDRFDAVLGAAEFHAEVAKADRDAAGNLEAAFSALLQVGKDREANPKDQRIENAFASLLNTALNRRATELIRAANSDLTAYPVASGGRFRRLMALKKLEGIQGTDRVKAITDASGTGKSPESAALGDWIKAILAQTGSKRNKRYTVIPEDRLKGFSDILGVSGVDQVADWSTYEQNIKNGQDVAVNDLIAAATNRTTHSTGEARFNALHALTATVQATLNGENNLAKLEAAKVRARADWIADANRTADPIVRLTALAAIRANNAARETKDWDGVAATIAGYEDRAIQARITEIVRANPANVLALEALRTTYGDIVARNLNVFYPALGRAEFHVEVAKADRDAAGDLEAAFSALVQVGKTRAANDRKLESIENAFNTLLEPELERRATALIADANDPTHFAVEDGACFRRLVELKKLEGIEGTSRVDAISGNPATVALQGESVALAAWITAQSDAHTIADPAVRLTGLQDILNNADVQSVAAWDTHQGNIQDAQDAAIGELIAAVVGTALVADGARFDALHALTADAQATLNSEANIAALEAAKVQAREDWIADAADATHAPDVRLAALAAIRNNANAVATRGWGTVAVENAILGHEDTAVANLITATAAAGSTANIRDELVALQTHLQDHHTDVYERTADDLSDRIANADLAVIIDPAGTPALVATPAPGTPLTHAELGNIQARYEGLFNARAAVDGAVDRTDRSKEALKGLIDLQLQAMNNVFNVAVEEVLAAQHVDAATLHAGVDDTAKETAYNLAKAAVLAPYGDALPAAPANEVERRALAAIQTGLDGLSKWQADTVLKSKVPELEKLEANLAVLAQKLSSLRTELETLTPAAGRLVTTETAKQLLADKIKEEEKRVMPEQLAEYLRKAGVEERAQATEGQRAVVRRGRK